MGNKFLKDTGGRILSLLVCIAMLVAGAFIYTGRLGGYSSMDKESGNDSGKLIVNSGNDGSVVINTSQKGKDIIGFAGPTPLEITVADGKVSSVVALDNNETPGFFQRASDGILQKWNGLPLDKALEEEVDAVSGATMSSNAIVRTFREAVSEYMQRDGGVAESFRFSWGWLCSLLVLLSGAILPFWIKNHIYRLVQQILDVAVLGFWTGKFISYTAIFGIMGNGVDLLASVVVIIMLVTAFIYPLFGKYNHYCNWICPYGALQELASKAGLRKIKISATVARRLELFRVGLWLALMFLIVTDLWVSWVDYEIFTAFRPEEASLWVVAVAVLFIVVSLFVARPFCRFVCPLGSIIKESEKTQ